MDATELNVLLVDDDIDCREFVAMALDANGIRVTQTGSAEEGLDLLTAQTFDLVLTDMNLPGMDGAEFIKHARSKGSRIPIILITGDSRLKTPSALSTYDAQAILVKPLDDGEALASSIREVLAAGA